MPGVTIKRMRRRRSSVSSIRWPHVPNGDLKALFRITALCHSLLARRRCLNGEECWEPLCISVLFSLHISLFWSIYYSPSQRPLQSFTLRPVQKKREGRKKKPGWPGNKCSYRAIYYAYFSAVCSLVAKTKFLATFFFANISYLIEKIFNIVRGGSIVEDTQNICTFSKVRNFFGFEGVSRVFVDGGPAVWISRCS